MKQEYLKQIKAMKNSDKEMKRAKIEKYKENILEMMSNDYESFCKALFDIELDTNDEETLETLYNFHYNSGTTLLALLED